MTLATVTETILLARPSRLALSLDAFLMAASLAGCAALFAHGGLEAFLFAGAGAAFGARNAVRGLRLRGAYSGGFAGLFVGALFAAFFHTLFGRAHATDLSQAPAGKFPAQLSASLRGGVLVSAIVSGFACRYR